MFISFLFVASKKKRNEPKKRKSRLHLLALKLEIKLANSLDVYYTSFSIFLTRRSDSARSPSSSLSASSCFFYSNNIIYVKFKISVLRSVSCWSLLSRVRLNSSLKFRLTCLNRRNIIVLWQK